MWGTGERAPCLGTTKDMLCKALEMGVCFHRSPTFGGTLGGGCSFLRVFERREIFLYLGKFFTRNLSEM